MKTPLLVTLIFLFCIGLAQAADLQSEYSELSEKKCKTLKGNEAAESREQICPGIAGYRLKHLEGDLRESITVVDPQGVEHPLDYWTVIAGGFSFLGDKAEWRVEKNGVKTIPRALIVRVSASENPDQPNQKTSYLAVAKITPAQICVTARISPGPQQNEKARAAADASGQQPCLTSLPKDK